MDYLYTILQIILFIKFDFLNTSFYLFKLENINNPRKSFAKLSDIYHADTQPISTAIPPILGVGLT